MKVLVTHASRHGSTAEIAAAIGSGIESRCRQHGYVVDVDVLPVARVRSVTEYDAVVLGSAVYVGHWLAPARDLVRTFTSELKAREVWLFSSGPIGDPPRPVEEPAEPAALVGVLGAHGHRLLAGRLDRGHLRMAERLVVRAVHAHDGDYRDWDVVNGWATEIADSLVRSSRHEHSDA